MPLRKIAAAKFRVDELIVKSGALQQAILNSANFSVIATDEKGIVQLFNAGDRREFLEKSSLRTRREGGRFCAVPISPCMKRRRPAESGAPPNVRPTERDLGSALRQWVTSTEEAHYADQGQ
jgi:hypothetical protein